MKFRCTVQQLERTVWSVRHVSPELGTVQVRGTSRDEVLKKMRGELRYRLEICPCTGELYADVDIELVE